MHGPPPEGLTLPRASGHIRAMAQAARILPSQQLTAARPNTASKASRPITHQRLSRWRLQPTDTSAKNRPSYDPPRRVPHLPQSGHDYSVYGTICARPLNASEMRNILSRFSLPRHSGEVASDGNYTVSQWGIPGGRVNVDFAGDGLSVRNTTLNPHICAGQIDRKIYSDRFGTFTTTRGTGSAEFLRGLRDGANQLPGPRIFRGLNEDAAAYVKQNYSGCAWR